MNPLETLSIKEWGTGIIVVILAIAVAAVGSYFKTSAQRPDQKADRASERLIEKRTNSAIPNEPVAITLAKTGKGAVPFNKPFKDDNSDWLKGFTLTAKNISQRTITYIDVTYSFVRSKGDANSDQPALVDTLTFGSLANNQKKLNPGDSTELVLSDATHDFLKAGLSQLGYPSSPKHIRFYVSQVIFEDGTMWSLGYWYQRDPADAQKWIRIPEVGKNAGPGRDGSKKDRAALKSHAAAGRSTTGPPPMSSFQNPCQDPGFPSWNTCTGADNENCRKKYQPTFPSLTVHTHRTVATLTACKQCINPTPSSLECESQPHCSGNVVFDSTFLPELCPPGGSCNAPPDFATYPSTGCVSGLTVINGVCQRSLAFQQRCAEPSGYDPATCTCPDGVNPSPIVIDVDRSGFAMTSAENGVDFNILNDGVPLRLSWTAGTSTNTFLAMDRNGNGAIDNGTELFGDLSPQPSSPDPNGFAALAQYDQRGAGGNENGKIDSGDLVFGRLVLWRDANHNGISEPSEMEDLSEYGVEGIDLKFHESRWVDQFGNQFRYRAKVYYSKGLRSERWAWDVFLKVN
jgi:hypothetical protein